MSIKRLVLNASALSVAKILAMASQFFVLPVIARYLPPSDFGVVAVAMIFVTFTMAVTDAGLGSSLVRTRQYEIEVWSSAFWFVASVGLLLSILLAVLSPLVAWWFETPEVQPILLVLALVPLMQGLLAVPQAEMQKRGAIPQIALGETLGTFAGFGVAIWIAVKGGGAWALVAQQLTFWLIRVVVVAISTRFRLHRIFSWHVLGEHLRFGRDTVGFALVNFTLRQSHTLVIGKSLGPHDLGVYTIASRFSYLPSDVVGGPVFYSLYAHLAAMAGDQAAMRHIILSISRLLAILIFAPMALVAAGGESFFTLFLSEKWASVAPIFTLIAPAGALQGVVVLYGTILLATGHTRRRLRIALEMALYWIVLLLISVWFGLEAVAFAYTFWYLSYLPRLTRLFLDTIDCRRRQYLGVLLVAAIVALATAGIHVGITWILALNAWQEVALLAVEVLLAWWITFLLERRKIFDDLRYLRQVLAASKRKGS